MMMTQTKLPLDQIIRNESQPRTVFDDSSIAELAESIKKDGLQSPIMVRPVNGKYEIVQGERRYRAAQVAGLSEIDAFIKELTDDDAFHLALIENIQREQLSPIEEANAFKRYVEMGYTHEEIAKKVSKSRTYVTSRLRLLKLIPEIQDMIAEGKISEGHAKQILKLRNDLPGSEQNERPFQVAQELFVHQFKDADKISVNDVKSWGELLTRRLITAILGVFIGGQGEKERVQLQACNELDLTIHDITKEHIELLITKELDELEPGQRRSEVYAYYEEIEQMIFWFDGDIDKKWTERVLDIYSAEIKKHMKTALEAKNDLVDAYRRAATMESGDSSRSLIELADRVDAMTPEEFFDYIIEKVSQDTI